MAQSRKIAQAEVVWVTGKDVKGLDDLRIALRKCAEGDVHLVGAGYARIGEIIQSNVTRLGLDESTRQICAFANRMACELLSDDEREFHYPGGCWIATAYDSYPPFRKKIDGKNSPQSEIRPVEKQQILMTQIFATVLSKDPKLEAAAKALLQHADSHGLFPKSDWITDA